MATAKNKAAKINKGGASKAFTAYREGSSYGSIVVALASLGMGKMHNLDAIVTEYCKRMPKEALADFKARKPRNKNGFDWRGRLKTNCYTVTRQDYGAPLRAVGFEVRASKGTFGLFAIKPQIAPATARATTATKATPKAVKKSKAAKK